MKRELVLNDWTRSKLDNEELVIGNLMQIEMAKEVIKLCDRKIKELKKK